MGGLAADYWRVVVVDGRVPRGEVEVVAVLLGDVPLGPQLRLHVAAGVGAGLLDGVHELVAGP